MTALDFPDNPTVGQTFDRWVWNGTRWVLQSSAAGSCVHAKGVMRPGLSGLAAASVSDATDVLSVSVVAGTRYRIHFQVRAILTTTTTPTAHLQMGLHVNGTFLADQYSFLAPNAFNDAVLTAEWTAAVTEVATFQVKVTPSIGASSVFTDAATGFFVVDQVGCRCGAVAGSVPVESGVDSIFGAIPGGGTVSDCVWQRIGDSVYFSARFSGLAAWASGTTVLIPITRFTPVARTDLPLTFHSGTPVPTSPTMRAVVQSTGLTLVASTGSVGTTSVSVSGMFRIAPGV